MFPLKELHFQERRKKGCLWVDCDSGKILSRNSALRIENFSSGGQRWVKQMLLTKRLGRSTLPGQG